MLFSLETVMKYTVSMHSEQVLSDVKSLTDKKVFLLLLELWKAVDKFAALLFCFNKI